MPGTARRGVGVLVDFEMMRNIIVVAILAIIEQAASLAISVVLAAIAR